MKSLLVIPILALCLVGCGNSSSAPNTAVKAKEPADVTLTADNQKSLFPFAAGNSWKYSTEFTIQAVNKPSQNLAGEIEYKVSKLTPGADGAMIATIDVIQNGAKKDGQEWVADRTGIYQLSMKPERINFSPRQPIIRFPATKPDTFRWEGTGVTPIGQTGKMRYAFKNDGMQVVDSDMGSMNSLFMQSAGSFTTSNGIAGNVVVNAWYSPGVGMVRFRQQVQLKDGSSVVTLRLKSYTVKK